MKVTAIRHGQTTGNVEHITQSQLPGKLTKQGIYEAERTAELLKEERFDRIYSSDLQRAVDTAKIIAKYHPNIEVITTKFLRERSLGNLDGGPYEAIPEILFDGTLLNYEAPGGESWQDVIDRLLIFLNDVYRHAPDAHILLVSHGWTLRVLRSLLSELTLEESLSDHIDNATALSWLMTDRITTKS